LLATQINPWRYLRDLILDAKEPVLEETGLKSVSKEARMGAWGREAPPTDTYAISDRKPESKHRDFMRIVRKVTGKNLAN
jgi:hypothetical protein